MAISAVLAAAADSQWSIVSHDGLRNMLNAIIRFAALAYE